MYVSTVFCEGRSSEAPFKNKNGGPTNPSGRDREQNGGISEGSKERPE